MTEDKRKKLTELGAETLADALLSLASHIDAADELIQRLIATPKENLRRYKQKLAGLKRRRRFILWRESADFANELETLLGDLKSAVEDPQTGVELIAAFYRADAAIFEKCDDSSGIIGNVFCLEAKNLFISYASKCQDKEWVSALVFDLVSDDNYGVRDILVDHANEYLPEDAIRDLIDKFQEAAAKKQDDFKKRHWLNQVESLARQIKDAPLFEKTRLVSWGELNAAACIDIARIYLESEDEKTALSRLQGVPAEEIGFRVDEYDNLLFDIYSKTGDTEELVEVAWRIFRRHRSAKTFSKLLSVIGEDKRDTIIEDEAKRILADKSLSLSDAAFLIGVDRLDMAEIYLLDRSAQLNGDFYGDLLSLAKAMESDGRWLCASIVYRALLGSILDRAYSKAYGHGVRYLKSLDRISESVLNWSDFDDHEAYLEKLRQQHGRKRSFWSRYEG